MMETIRIRRAGYPIRHTFREFVERYRFLISGCPPPHKVSPIWESFNLRTSKTIYLHQVDCRQATSRICASTLGKSDYQLGQTKVFLKDAQDLFLEQERDRVLTKKLVVIQRCVRGWIYRRRYLRMRSAAIVIQRQWRRQAQRKRYLEMRGGFLRLQALIRSRILSHRFQHLRGHIVGLQARCRGYLIRRALHRKMRAAILIQSHVRRLIAQRRYKKLKREYRERMEILRLRELEEKKDKKLAEKRYKVIRIFL